MIIIMKESEINRKAAEALMRIYNISNLYLYSDAILKMREDDSSYCIIIDFNDESHLAKNSISPQQFSAKLMAAGLPKTVKHVYLLVSEVSAEYPLSAYAHHFALNFAEVFQRKIAVHTVSSLNFEMSVLALSSKETWQIYGLRKENLPTAIEEASSELLPKINNKKLIWEGENILDYMQSPQQTFDGTAYVWSQD